MNNNNNKWTKIENKKWTKEELNRYIENNCDTNDDGYSIAAILAAFYIKLYGFPLPEMGLTGTQEFFAEKISQSLPDK